MIDDSILRTAAVVAAAALLAAPYWEAITRWLAAASEAAYAQRSAIGRITAALLLIAAAWGHVPLRLPAVAPTASVDVETPSVEMQRLVQPIADAMKAVPTGDRMLWAATWSKAAVVVEGDAVATEVAFTDTRSLRLFTVLALDIAWRRIGQHVPGGNEPLRRAVEESYATAVGKEVVPVTKDVRERYAAFAKAVAWAGVNGG